MREKLLLIALSFFMVHGPAGLRAADATLRTDKQGARIVLPPRSMLALEVVE